MNTSDAPVAKILLVEDNPVNMTLLKRHLTPMGHQLREAVNGREALEQVANDPPDLILLDVMMPEVDGFEVCRQIKANENWRRIPIIIITALNETADHVQAIECGADDFMTKPISAPVLLARVRGYLRAKLLGDENLRLERLKEDLIHMVIHDLSSPLTGLSGYLDMLQADATLDTGTRERVLGASLAAQTMMRLISNLRSIHKLESGTLKPQLRPLEFKQLLEQVVRTFQPACEDRRLRIETEGAPVACEWDQDLMARMLQNLLDNAIGHSPPDAPIKLSWEVCAEQLHLKVCNHGPAIPPDQQERIFSKFAQVEGRMGGRRGGSGLGLAYCRLAANLHGGRIAVHSPLPEARDGACFEVRIPLKVPAEVG